MDRVTAKYTKIQWLSHLVVVFFCVGFYCKTSFKHLLAGFLVVGIQKRNREKY